jgi:hypothetical protein
MNLIHLAVLHKNRQRNLLFGEPSLSVIFSSRVVILGLGHSVSKVNILLPVILNISSTFDVELSVVKEFSSLVDVLLVVVRFLLVILCADGLVLRLGQSLGNISIVGELSN